MSILQDVRFALRQLRKAPTFTLVAMLTLGLAVAANTVVFSVVNAILIRPAPVSGLGDARSGIDIVQFVNAGASIKFWVGSMRPEYLRLLVARRALVRVGSARGPDRQREPSRGAISRSPSTTVDVTAGRFLPTLGVPPLLGRYFDASEATPPATGARSSSGTGLWQRAFGGDPERDRQDGPASTAIPVTIVGA